MKQYTEEHRKQKKAGREGRMATEVEVIQSQQQREDMGIVAGENQDRSESENCERDPPRVEVTFEEQHPEDEEGSFRRVNVSVDCQTPKSQNSTSSMATVVQGMTPLQMNVQRSQTPRASTSDLPVLTPIYPVAQPPVRPESAPNAGTASATRSFFSTNGQPQRNRAPSDTALEIPTPGQVQWRPPTPHARGGMDPSSTTVTSSSKGFFASTPARSSSLPRNGGDGYWGGSSSAVNTPAAASTNATPTGSAVIIRDIDDVEALGSEIDILDNQYRSQRELLQQRVEEHDSRFMAKSQLFQGKLTAIIDKTRQSSDERMTHMEQVWNEKLLQLQDNQNKAMEQERRERAQLVSRLEHKLERREEEVENLKQQLKGQEVTVKEAQTDREALQKEIKNILVTLHFQFEHLTNQAAKQEEYVKAIEEKTQLASTGIDRNVEEVTTYVDSVQYEVSQIQLETKALWRQCEDEQQAALAGVEKKLTKAIDDNYEESQDEMSDQKNKVKVVAEALRVKANNLEGLIQTLQDETDERLQKMSEELETLKESMTSSCNKRIQDAEATILNKVSARVGDLASTFEIADRDIQSQSAFTTSLQSTVEALAKKCDGIVQMTEDVQHETAAKFDSVNSKIEENTGVSNALGEKLGSLRKKLTESHETWQDKFASLTTDFMYQRSAHIEFTAKQDEQNESTTELRSNLRTALEHVNVLTSRLGDLHSNQENTTRSVDQTKEHYEGLIKATEDKMQALESLFTKASQDLNQETESQQLAFREFALKQSTLEAAMVTCDEQRKEMLSRLDGLESSLTHLSTSESLTSAMEPLAEKQTATESELQSHASNIQSLREEIEANCVKRSQLEETIAAMNQEADKSRSPLSAGIQIDATETVLKDLQNQVEQWQLKLNEVATLQETTKGDLEAVQNEQKVHLEQVNAKLDSWATRRQEIEKGTGSEEDTNSDVKLELVAAKATMERRLTDHLTMLTDWKNRIEESLDKREQRVAKQLKSQQHAADKQAARIVLKAAKTERESCQRELEAKIDTWNERFEAYVDQTRTDVADLHQNIREAQISGQDGALPRDLLKNMFSEWSENVDSPLQQTREDVLKLQKTVEDIKTFDKEAMIAELEKRMDAWNTQYNEVVQGIRDGIAEQIRSQTTEKSSTKSDLDTNLKELSEMEAKLKLTTQKLNDTRYECRGLRRQMSNRAKSVRSQSGSESESQKQSAQTSWLSKFTS